MLRKSKLGLSLASIFLLAACTGNFKTPITVDQDDNDPSPTPTATATAMPTASPTAMPTASPSASPTASPTASPSASPSANPSPTASPSSNTVTINFFPVMQFNINGSIHITAVLSNGQELLDFFRTYLPGKPLPNVDFTHNTVLAILGGPQSTTSTSTTVLDIKKTDKMLKVRYKTTTTTTTTTGNNPVQIVVVPVSKLTGEITRVDFEHTP